jgi:hypothetical protein
MSATNIFAYLTKTVLRLSQPWSNNSPNGEAVWVLRACFPSIASEIVIIAFQDENVKRRIISYNGTI